MPPTPRLRSSASSSSSDCRRDLEGGSDGAGATSSVAPSWAWKGLLPVSKFLAVALRFNFPESFLRSLRALDWPRAERLDEAVAPPPAPRGCDEVALVKLDAALLLLSLTFDFGMEPRSAGGLAAFGS